MEGFSEEFTKPVLLCFTLLSKCNIKFFDDNVPFLQKYWRFLIFVPIVVTHYLSIGFYISRIFKTNLSELAFLLPFHLILTQDFLKSSITLSNKANIARLITKLGEMWRSDNLTAVQIEKKKILLKRLDFSYALLYYGSMGAMWQNVLAPLYFALFKKFIVHQDTVLVLPFPCVFPFDPVENWYNYSVVYIFQILAMLIIAGNYIGMQFLLITLCALLTTEFALLSEDLKHIAPRNKNSVYGTERNQGAIVGIRSFVQTHQKLIELAESLNGIFNGIVFIDMLFITVILSFFGFGITVARGALDIINNSVVVLAMLFPIYEVCYYADLLKEESSGIADSAYDSLWYNSDKAYKQAILFIIARTQHPCYLTSLNYAPVTLNTFTKVVSTTWSYFSLARSMYAENLE